MVAALALILPVCSPAAAAGASIFVDANDNGVFDAGDVDVTQTLKTTGVVETDGSLVVPAGAVLRLALDSVSLRAEKAIRVAGVLSNTGSVFMRTESGPITLAPRSTVLAYDTLQITAGGDLVMDAARVQSYYDVAMLESINGLIQANRAVLYASKRLEINSYAAGGGLKAVGTTMQARGLINLHIEGTAELHQARLTATDLNVSVTGGYAELCYSIVRVASRTGVVMVSVESVQDPAGLASSGSYLDVTATKFYAAPGNIVMNADQMVGY
jgi:hypothetical protein